MKVIIPFNKHEITRADNFIKVLAALRCYSDAITFIVHASPDVSDKAEIFVKELCNFYPSTRLVKLAEPMYEEYPKGANFAFREAVNYSLLMLAKQGNKEPFYFFELDTVPVIKDWAEQIRSEYFASKATYLGHVKPHIYEGYDENGKPAQIKDGQYMVGTGVYPYNFYHLTKTWKALSSGPFDIYARYAVGKFATHTDLIYSIGKSKDYTVNAAGHLSCDMITSGKKLNNIDLSKSAVVHGCKDDSLTNIVISGFKTCHTNEELKEDETNKEQLSDLPQIEPPVTTEQEQAPAPEPKKVRQKRSGKKEIII